jgi:exodeoxyribonuclease VII large subunit
MVRLPCLSLFSWPFFILWTYLIGGAIIPYVPFLLSFDLHFSLQSGCPDIRMKDSQKKPVDQLFTPPRAQTVSELTARIKSGLERDFTSLLIQGEMSDLSKPSSGHWYFSLKDGQSQIRVVCFKSANRLIRFRPQNGISVVVRGRLSVYLTGGYYQLQVDWIEPIGTGSIQLAFEQQYRRLKAEGLFDPGRKRKLPLLPRRVGIVTSPTGAAIQDILRVLERRNPGLDIVIAPVRVQGEGAANEIAEGIRRLNQMAQKQDYPIDVLIVGRGGGSSEDLWAFNEEVVARAIHDSAIPVVSAVGHETDTSISDLVADVRSATPSAAAETISAGTTDLLMRVDELRAALEAAIRYYLLRRRSRLKDLVASQAINDSANRIRNSRRRVDQLMELARRSLTNRLAVARLSIHRSQLRLAAIDPRRPLVISAKRLAALDQQLYQLIDEGVSTRRSRFALLSGRLQAFSPLAVLARGYTIVTDDSALLVTKAAAITPDSRLTVRFIDGLVDCNVVNVRLKDD